MQALLRHHRAAGANQPADHGCALGGRADRWPAGAVPGGFRGAPDTGV